VIDELINGCFLSADYKEGREAFMEKPIPDFKGFAGQAERPSWHRSEMPSPGIISIGNLLRGQAWWRTGSV